MPAHGFCLMDVGSAWTLLYERHEQEWQLALARDTDFKQLAAQRRARMFLRVARALRREEAPWRRNTMFATGPLAVAAAPLPAAASAPAAAKARASLVRRASPAVTSSLRARCGAAQ